MSKVVDDAELLDKFHFACNVRRGWAQFSTLQPVLLS